MSSRSNNSISGLATRPAQAPTWSNKTHSAYPEIQVAPDGEWALRFYDYAGSGEIVEEHSGTETDEISAKAKAVAVMHGVIDKYQRS